MTTVLLLAAFAVDLVLIAVAASPSGFSRALGPIHVRLHDPSVLLLLAAFLGACLVGVSWATRARGWALSGAAAAVAACGVLLTRPAEKMFPLGDIAVIELYVRNALTGQLLVGPYSRFGWHHPGPIYFYVLAPFYALAGHTTASLAAGAAVVTTASMALVAWVGARSLGPRASAIVLASLVLFLWRVPDLAASAWNPHIVMLPAVALVVVAAACASGDVVLLPLLVALATFIVQTDVALVPVAGVVAGSGVVAGLATSWREKKRATLKSLNFAAWAALALWLPVLAEQTTRSPGNLTLLWRFFVGAQGHGQTFMAATTAWAVMITSPFSAAVALAGGGTFETNSAGSSIVLAMVELLALSLAATWTRKSAPPLAQLAAFSLAASVIALWSATRIEERIMDHEVFWIAALGALNLGIIAAVAGARLRELASLPAIPFMRSGGLVYGALLGACMAICFSQLDRARQGRLPVTATSGVVERVAWSARQYLEQQHAGKPFVRIGEDNWGFAAGVLLELDRGAIPFAVEGSWMPMFPHSFAANGSEDAEIAFGNGDEHVTRMAISGSAPITSFSSTYLDGLPRARR